MSEAWISEENMFGELEMPIRDAMVLFMYGMRLAKNKKVPFHLMLNVRKVQRKYGWNEDQLNTIAKILYERRDQWRLK